MLEHQIAVDTPGVPSVNYSTGERFALLGMLVTYSMLLGGASLILVRMAGL